MKYEIELHIFQKKLNQIMIEKGLVNKKGKADPIKLYNLLYPNSPITEDMLKLDRQNCTNMTRNILNWIQGKNYPKSIKDILSLCNALDCDLDYFFTDMECPTHDLQFIHKETGLSQYSIELLQHWNKMSQNPRSGYAWARNSIRAINDLLSCEQWFSEVLNQIADYCYYRNAYESPGEKQIKKSDALEKYRLALFTASDKFSECIKDIYNNYVNKKGTV